MLQITFVKKNCTFTNNIRYASTLYMQDIHVAPKVIEVIQLATNDKKLNIEPDSDFILRRYLYNLYVQ